MKSWPVVIGLFTWWLPAAAQENEHLTREINCYEKVAFATFDMLISSRTFGEYESVAEWSAWVTGNDIIQKIFPLESGLQYVILLTTEQKVDATAIEIRDSQGEQLDYVFKINELDNNQINAFFTAPLSDVYQISFRTINSRKSRTCMYMGILKGEEDPEEE